MDRPRHIEDLADELLSEILSFLLGPEPSQYDFLHTGALEVPSESNGYGERLDLDRFRLVNKRFMRIGTPRRFSRFVLRFSREGFKRLEDFLDMRLACYVRHFTYMVRPFYQGSGWLQVLNGSGASNLPISVLRSRLEDQTCLTDTGHDLVLLRRAFASFSSLQQVKLLRLQDGADQKLINHILYNPIHGSVDWEPACTRAIANLGSALLESKCNPIRFIGPHISIETTKRLHTISSKTLAAIGPRLASLDLSLPFPFITNAMLNTTLISTFHTFFQSTTPTLTTLHLHFPPKTPLRISLTQILPATIHWTRLHTLSLQSWHLSASEIIALLRRHRRTLREIRLRSIYLNDGAGKWTDVLAVLCDEMELLGCVELRGIDYERHFDMSFHGNGNGIGHGGGGSGDDINLVLEQLRTLTVDDLGDDGRLVRPGQDRFWEAWVLACRT